MRQLRIALGQLDVTVGDLDGNVNAIIDAVTDAAARGADLVAVPQLAVTGFPPHDLALRESVRAASGVRPHQIARRLGDAGLGHVAVVLGYLRGGDDARNSASFLHGGRVVATYDKHHLSKYAGFDEKQYFVPGSRLPVVRLHGIDIAFVIGEDLWRDSGPLSAAGPAGVGLVVALDGTTYHWGKADTFEAIARRAADVGATIARVNLVGAQDELIFDGGSQVVGADGTLLGRADQFVPGLLVVDADLPRAAGEVSGPIAETLVERHTVGDDPVPRREPVPQAIAETRSGEAELWAALVAAVRSFATKNGFTTAVLGVSGGVDSSVVAALAVDALGADNTYCVSMPSRYSSDHSRTDADELASRLGCHYQRIPIEPIMSAFLDTIELTGGAEGNLQARIRSCLLMGLSNQHGHLVLATSNRSEAAVGYATLYGDSAGGFAPLKDVPKTLVWRLAQWRDADAERRGQVAPIPENSITKKPSAELHPGQFDTDDLPPYEELDALLADYLDAGLGADRLVGRGHDPAVVRRTLRTIDQVEFKRRQGPIGPLVITPAARRDTHLPITNRWSETVRHDQ